MTPGNAVLAFGLLLAASTAIPFYIARRWGWRTAAVFVAVWMVLWATGLKADGLSFEEAIGIALIGPTLFWAVGALAGGVTKQNNSSPRMNNSE